MRPGQAAPEFAGACRRERRAPAGFNEAGAGCPGIPAAGETYRLAILPLQ